MDPRLTWESVEVMIVDLRREADVDRSAIDARRAADVILRRASAHDARDLERLSQLDSAASPTGPVLVAEVDGELVAALRLDGGGPIADPFRPTAEVVRLLELRAAQLKGGRRGPLRRLLPARLRRRAAER